MTTDLNDQDQLASDEDNLELLPRKLFTISVIATKGGAGKTTLAANLGQLLADLGFRVLMIDADIQPSLSAYFPIAEQAPYGLTQLLRTGVASAEQISKTTTPGLDIIVSDDVENFLQTWLMPRLDRGTRLRMAINSPHLRENYDFVLIDTQGAMGPLQEAAGLAADIMLSPLCPDSLSARAFLHGTIELLDRLSLGGTPGQMFAVIYKQGRLRDSHQIAETVRSHFVSLGGKVSMLNPVIPVAKVFLEAATAKMGVHRLETEWQDTVLDKQGRVSSLGTGTAMMHRLLWELVPSLSGMTADASRMEGRRHD